ncbi:glutathione S-transferase family protein [Xylophilus rhododendri]|nr:glutathione S-transferase family protein [Xylophilus rhododendri]
MTHIALEELGIPFTLEFVDRSINAQKSKYFLDKNPNGLIPVITDGDLTLFETPAILLYLSDKYPDAKLAPAVGSTDRAHCYKWVSWLSNTLQAMLVTYFYSERYVLPGNTAGAAEVKDCAGARVEKLLLQLENELSKKGPWLLGADYSIADCMAFVLCCWTRNLNQPANSLPFLKKYLQSVRSRPAVQRAIATEKIQESFFSSAG